MQTPASDLVLPSHLRETLAEPFGPIVSTSELETELAGAEFVAVGDMVAITAKQLGLLPRFIVVDYTTKRGDEDPIMRFSLESWCDDEIKIKNPAGALTRQCWDAVKQAFAFEGMTRIVVEGEEDLLGLVVFALAPAGTKVIYGMPDKGIVVVPVEDHIKQRVQGLLEQMIAAGD